QLTARLFEVYKKPEAQAEDDVILGLRLGLYCWRRVQAEDTPSSACASGFIAGTAYLLSMALTSAQSAAIVLPTRASALCAMSSVFLLEPRTVHVSSVDHAHDRHRGAVDRGCR